MSRGPGGRDRVGFDWGASGLAAALDRPGRPPIVVVVDVLSFSTAVVTACAADVLIRPVPPDRIPADLEGAILAGSRGSVVSLSPGSLAGLPPGTEVVLPSPNGAALSSIAEDAGAVVLAGSLRNARAAARAVHRLLAADPERAALVLAAGERWPDGSLRVALEDHAGAGAVLAGLPEEWLTAEGRAAAALARAIEPAELRGCASAVELVGAGFERDVAIALEADAATVVPVLEDGWFRAAPEHLCPHRG